MERSILKEITPKRLDAFLKKNKFNSTYWPRFFGLKFRTELTWEALQGEKGSNVIADVISYDASAPEKGRETIGKASGKITKIAVKRSMKESDLLEYDRLKTSATPDQALLLDLVFNDPEFVVNAVNGRTEWLALQALSTGRVILDKNNNNGIITETAVGFGVPASNRKFVAKKWSDPASATPIADIKEQQKNARKKAVTLKYCLMDAETFENIVATEEFKKAFGFMLSKNDVVANQTISLEDANKLMSKNRLPKIVIIESYQRIEKEDGTRTVISPWEAGYVTFLTDAKAGRIQHGPIMEEQSEAVKKIAIQAKKGHILISKYADLDPLREFTKGEANCFPVLSNPEDIFMLNTENTNQFYN